MTKGKGHDALCDVELDFDVLAELQDLDAEGSLVFFRHLIDLFLNEAKRHVQELRLTLNPLVPDNAARLVHRLRSSSANLGAISFARLCERLEHELKVVPPKWTTLEDLVSKLDSQLPSLEQALRTISHGNRQSPIP